MLQAKSLSDLRIMATLSPSEVKILANVMREVNVAPGAALYRQGTRASACHFVLEGELQVYLEDPAGRRALGPVAKGELVGEIALLDGGLRSATCEGGSEGARLAELSKADFDQVFAAQSPFAFKLMDLIADRLVRRFRGSMDMLVERALEDQEPSA